jgi:hypothetical protein
MHRKKMICGMVAVNDDRKQGRSRGLPAGDDRVAVAVTVDLGAATETPEFFQIRVTN